MALSTWLQIINLKIETKRTAVQGTLSSSEMHAIHTEMTLSIYRHSASEDRKTVCDNPQRQHWPHKAHHLQTS